MKTFISFLQFIKNNKIQFFRIKFFRFWYTKMRYEKLKNKMDFYTNGSSHIGENTVKYNLSAFNTDAVFGCGDRMGLLIYPVVAYYTFYTIKKQLKKVLIVGCRSEDDIFWLKSYGFNQTIGFDLFSYSRFVTLGDIHKTEYQDATFDVVLLGWMISYTKSTTDVIKECKRILKPNGLLGIGIEHDQKQNVENLGSIRMNPLNSTNDIKVLLDSVVTHKILFEYDHYNDKDGDFSTAVVTICY